MPAYPTLAAETHLEPPPIKGSRFIGDAIPVHTAGEAKAFIQRIQALESGASHHCYAWRLHAGDQGWRVSDDGEPGGTAGLPILARIDGAELRGLAVVITRYFGGTKLGRGGLIRAYGGTAGLLLDQAEIIEVRECQNLGITLDYSDQGAIQGVLRNRALVPKREEFGVQIHFQVSVPVEQVLAFQAELRDRTSGRVVAEVLTDSTA